MTTNLPKFDLSKDYALSQALPLTSALSSYSAGWQGIQLECLQASPLEVPEYTCQQHLITIPTVDGLKVQRTATGKLHHAIFHPGDFCLSPRELSLKVRWEQNLEAIQLILEPDFIAQAAYELVDPDQVELRNHVKSNDPLIYNLGIALKQSLETFGKDSKLYADSAAAFLAIHLLKHYAIRKPKHQKHSDGLSASQLRRVTEYINDHLSESICLDTLSTHLGMSRYYFCRLFKQSTGFSPYQYIIRCRVERAKRILKRGGLSLAEVALACGFSHQSHFHRHFKRLVGVTPKSFISSQM